MSRKKWIQAISLLQENDVLRKIVSLEDIVRQGLPHASSNLLVELFKLNLPELNFRLAEEAAKRGRCDLHILACEAYQKSKSPSDFHAYLPSLLKIAYKTKNKRVLQNLISTNHFWVLNDIYEKVTSEQKSYIVHFCLQEMKYKPIISVYDGIITHAFQHGIISKKTYVEAIEDAIQKGKASFHTDMISLACKEAVKAPIIWKLLWEVYRDTPKTAEMYADIIEHIDAKEHPEIMKEAWAFLRDNCEWKGLTADPRPLLMCHVKSSWRSVRPLFLSTPEIRNEAMLLHLKKLCEIPNPLDFKEDFTEMYHTLTGMPKEEISMLAENYMSMERIL